MSATQWKVFLAAWLTAFSALGAVRPQFEVVPITNLDRTNGYFGFPLRINNAGQMHWPTACLEKGSRPSRSLPSASRR
jgi:hypothetical protein